MSLLLAVHVLLCRCISRSNASTRRPTLVFCGIARPHPLQLHTSFLCALPARRLLRVCPRNWDCAATEVRPAAALRSRAWRHHRPRPRPSTPHRLACLRCNCARWTSRNALCAFQDIVRRIKGFAATVLLSFKWLWPLTACHWLWSLPFAPRDPPVIIVVSGAQLDDRGLSSLPNAGIGDLTYLGLTFCSIRWHWSCLVAGSRVVTQPPEARNIFWIKSNSQFDCRLFSSYSAIACSCAYK